jgi:hypothetical protein
MTPRKRAGRRIAARTALALLAAIVLIDALVPHKPHFAGSGYTFDTLPFFYPALGFLSTLLLVLISRGLGILLSRREKYYREP